MKILKSFLFLSLVLLSTFNSVFTKKMHKNKKVPRGQKLRNHFGTPMVSSPYGPQDDFIAQYVVANPDSFAPQLGLKNMEALRHNNDFHPYEGMNNRNNPSPVKSGEYTNIAPSATHEVRPEITGPKVEVAGEIEYPSVVKTPTFYGFTKEFHPIVAYDKLTGEIIEDNVLINRPVYNYENRVANVKREFNQFYDLRTGDKISVTPNIKSHGFNQIPDPDDVVVKNRVHKHKSK